MSFSPYLQLPCIQRAPLPRREVASDFSLLVAGASSEMMALCENVSLFLCRFYSKRASHILLTFKPQKTINSKLILSSSLSSFFSY